MSEGQTKVSDVEAVTTAISFLMNQSELFELESFDLAEDDLAQRIEDLVSSGKITVGFFGDDDNFDLTVGDFLKLVAECNSIKSIGNGFLRTTHFAIQKIAAESEEALRCVFGGQDLAMSYHNVSLDVTDRSFITGFNAIQIGAFHKDYYSPVTSHTVVEADFSKSTRRRSQEDDLDVIDAYLFELAASHGIVFKKEPFSLFEEPDWENESDKTYRFRTLENSNDGMRLFLTASSVTDPELRFLSMFKVLEWLGPTVSNIGAADAMRKKLDNADTLNPTGLFLREIFELAKDFDARRNERDQIKAVLSEATDLVHLNLELPPFLRRDLMHSSPPADHEKLARDVSECLCSTRNQVAHAKSNYSAKGTECPPEQLPKLNAFLREAAIQAVRWFNRLPEHQRTLPCVFPKS